MYNRDTPPPSWYEPPDPPVITYTDTWNDAKHIDEQIATLVDAVEDSDLSPDLVTYLHMLMNASDETLKWLQQKITEEKTDE